MILCDTQSTEAMIFLMDHPGRCHPGHPRNDVVVIEIRLRAESRHGTCHVLAFIFGTSLSTPHLVLISTSIGIVLSGSIIAEVCPIIKLEQLGRYNSSANHLRPRVYESQLPSHLIDCPLPLTGRGL